MSEEELSLDEQKKMSRGFFKVFIENIEHFYSQLRDRNVDIETATHMITHALAPTIASWTYRVIGGNNILKHQLDYLDVICNNAKEIIKHAHSLKNKDFQ